MAKKLQIYKLGSLGHLNKLFQTGSIEKIKGILSKIGHNVKLASNFHGLSDCPGKIAKS